MLFYNQNDFMTETKPNFILLFVKCFIRLWKLLNNVNEKNLETMCGTNNVLHVAIFLTLCSPSLCEYTKLKEGAAITHDSALIFFSMFYNCLSSPVSNQHFISDDLKNYVNYPSKTTVGIAQKFTSNRKFFANLINTSAFKHMIAKDEEALRNDVVKKMKYCDDVVMDQEMLKDLYDREVDQSKI